MSLIWGGGKQLICHSRVVLGQDGAASLYAFNKCWHDVRHGTRIGRIIVRRSTLIVECERLILLSSINVYLLSIAILLDLLLSSRLLFKQDLHSPVVRSLTHEWVAAKFLANPEKAAQAFPFNTSTGFHYSIRTLSDNTGWLLLALVSLNRCECPTRGCIFRA